VEKRFSEGKDFAILVLLKILEALTDDGDLSNIFLLNTCFLRNLTYLLFIRNWKKAEIFANSRCESN
jgi:hypothetical protein